MPEPRQLRRPRRTTSDPGVVQSPKTNEKQCLADKLTLGEIGLLTLATSHPETKHEGALYRPNEWNDVFGGTAHVGRLLGRLEAKDKIVLHGYWLPESADGCPPADCGSRSTSRPVDTVLCTRSTRPVLLCRGWPRFRRTSSRCGSSESRAARVLCRDSLHTIRSPRRHPNQLTAAVRTIHHRRWSRAESTPATPATCRAATLPVESSFSWRGGPSR